MADEKILWCDVKDLFFRGPESNEQVMVSILDPVITVEYHNEHYYIAARFNIETTILHYESHKRDGHELFFEDICLQYLSKDTEEKLKVHPQSDPAGSFSVTTTSTTSVTGQVGVTGSQTPSGNVMLGVTRSKQLAVQYNVNTWSVSAHRMIPDDKQKRLKLKSDKVILNGRPMAGSELPSSYYDDPNQDYYHLAYGDELAIHQWYWQGTQAATKTLSPDLKYTVKRHVFVKRIIPRADFPTDRVRSGKRLHKVLKQEIRPREMSSHRSERLAAQRDRETRDIVKEEFRQAMFADSLALDQLLDFGFHLTVRVKKRFGRTHRTLMFSSNKVKADFLNPPYTQLFRIKVDPSLQILRDIPLSDTPNLEKILADVKEEYDGKLDDLLGASLDEVTDENLRVIKRGETPRPIRATRRHSIDQQQGLRATRRAERAREHRARESRPVEIEIESIHPTSRERPFVFEEDERRYPRVYSERVAQPERHIDLSPNILRRGRSSPVIIV